MDTSQVACSHLPAGTDDVAARGVEFARISLALVLASRDGFGAGPVVAPPPSGSSCAAPRVDNAITKRVDAIGMSLGMQVLQKAVRASKITIAATKSPTYLVPTRPRGTTTDGVAPGTSTNAQPGASPGASRQRHDRRETRLDSAEVRHDQGLLRLPVRFGGCHQVDARVLPHRV